MDNENGSPKGVNDHRCQACNTILFVFLALLAIATFGVWTINHRAITAHISFSHPEIVAQQVAPNTSLLKNKVEQKAEPQVVPTVSSVAPTLPVIYKHTLKWGDTLTKLAKRTCDTPQAIATRNSITLASIIYAGKSINLQKVEHCSPESVKAKAFPEKFSSKTAGASREKSLSLESGTTRSNVASAPTTVHSHCPRVGSRVRDYSARVLLRADCIRTKYGAMILDATRTIDPRLSANEVIAVMMHESKGDPNAVSKAKDPCFGLMQLQGGTANDYQVRDVFDPRQNIYGGVRVLSDYTFRHSRGDRARGLASYNMGPHHKRLRDGSINPLHLRYVKEVQKIHRVLEDNQFSL